jgi:hypothetical protein
MQVDGTASGVASAVAAGLSNRIVGLAFGSSTAQHFGQFSGLASGTSTAVGAFDAWSKFRPKDLFTGYGFDGTSITIPIAGLAGITPTEADTADGDWRELMRAVFSTTHTYHNGLAVSDRPSAFDATLVQWFSDGYNAKMFYTFKFFTDDGDPPKVVPEP